MNATEIRDAIGDAIVARGLFIVEIKVSRDNDVELTIESEKGTVTLDDCTEVSRLTEEKFDREKEDYSLTVTSAGLDRPFKVLGQYVKAIGSEVEVSLRNGKRFRAVLTAADPDSITVRHKVMVAEEGKKRKTAVEREDVLPMESVNSVKPHIDF